MRMKERVVEGRQKYVAAEDGRNCWRRHGRASGGGANKKTGVSALR